MGVAEAVVAENTSWVVVRHGHERGDVMQVMILARVPSEILVEVRYAAIELATVVITLDRFLVPAR